eukprot:1157719-Pelagomonas_calceolata.AAC.4
MLTRAFKVINFNPMPLHATQATYLPRSAVLPLHNQPTAAQPLAATLLKVAARVLLLPAHAGLEHSGQA